MTYKVTMLDRQRLDCDGCGVAEVDFETLASHVANAIHDGAPAPGWTTETVDGIRMDYCGKCSGVVAENTRLRHMLNLHREESKVFREGLQKLVLEANEVAMARLEAIDHRSPNETRVYLLPAGADPKPPLLALQIQDAVQTFRECVAAMQSEGFKFNASTHEELDSPALILSALQCDGTVWILGPGSVPTYQAILTTRGKVT